MADLSEGPNAKKAARAMRPRPAAEAVFGGRGMVDLALAAPAAPPPAPPSPSDDEGGAAPGEPEAPLTRAWFPETFLFAPSVLTDTAGKGSVSVRVPDRLTTWRVLALAHSRQGAQAGAVTTFASLLPVSVDVVVPRFIVAGDRLALPIQVQNTTNEAVRRALSLKVDGGTLEGAPTSIAVDAAASASLSATLVTRRPGTVAITAAIGDDAVVRSVDVLPAGQPRHLEQSATLATPRTFTFTTDAADEAPIDGSARVTANVFPGALAVLRTELLSASGRVSLEDDGALLQLSATAEPLAQKLGHAALTTAGSPEQQGLVRLRRLAAQRLARHALSPSLTSATALGGGAAMHDKESLIGRTGEHLLSWLARQQRPDGTWGGGSGMTVQQLLVTTVDALLPLQAAAGAPGASDDAKRRAAQATISASGAFARLLPQAEDPYTAACVLMTGAVDDEQRKALVDVIVKAAVAQPDGSKTITVADVVRRDGRAPDAVEVAARTILALRGDDKHKALRQDLGAFVLTRYRAGGFGDGLTTRHALAAVLEVFDGPPPAQVVLTLTVDGRATATETLSGAKLTEALTLAAPLKALTASGAVIGVSAEPAVPGLAVTVALDYAVPVPKPSPTAGLVLERQAPERLRVGVPTPLTVTALVPGGESCEIEIGLPAGVDVVQRSLEELRDNDVILEFDSKDGVITMVAPSRAQGELFKATVQVVPTLAGALSERHAVVRALGQEQYVPPLVWRIGR